MMEQQLKSIVIVLLLCLVPLALGRQPPIRERSYGHIKGYHTFSSPRSESYDGPFKRNNNLKISWDHPEVVRQLWRGKPVPSGLSSPSGGIARRALVKRNDGRTEMPGGWPQSKHCLGCFKRNQDGPVEINDLSTDWLVTQILVSEEDMKDKCVFYTGVPNDEREELAFWLADGENLSPSAAKWACDNGLLSLWTLYPGRDSNVAPGGAVEDDDVSRMNFWEIGTPGSWLNHLDYSPVRYTYFENMSEAMARQCSGKVWVYSISPLKLGWYGTQTEADQNNNAHSIWNSKELPELRRQRKTTMLIGVDVNTERMYELNLNTLALIREYTGPVPRSVEGALSKRNTCLSNLNYQTPGDDWFGTGRRSGP